MGSPAGASSWSTGWLIILALAAVGASLVLPLMAVFAGPALLAASVFAFRGAQTWDARATAVVAGGLGAGLCLLVVVLTVSLAV